MIGHPRGTPRYETSLTVSLAHCAIDHGDADCDCKADDVDVEVVGTVTPTVPGRYSGPPEDCYPDEGGEVEVEHVWLTGERPAGSPPWAPWPRVRELTGDEVDQVRDACEDALRDAAIETDRDAEEA